MTIILLAIAVIGLRLGLNNIDIFKSDIESWLAKDVAPGIRFTSIQGGWKQFNPVLRLNNASIVLPNRKQTTAIGYMSVEFDIWKSLRIRSPVVREISGTINKLNLRKDSRHQWWLNELSLGGANADNTKSDIKQLIAQIPYYLHLRLNRLIVFDQTLDENYQIDNIEIDAQHRDGSHYLQLNAKLPELLGNKLNLKSVISQENSVVYLQADRLELDRMASLFGVNLGGIKQAEFAGEVWLNFLDNQTLAMNGNISINQGLFQTRPGSELLPFTLDSQISIYQVKNRWDISNRFESLSINYLPLQEFDSELRVVMANGEATKVEGWVEDFDLSSLKKFDRQLLPVKIADALIQSELRGQLNNLWFSLEPDNINNLQLMTEAANITSRPFNNIPGVKRIDGYVVLGNQNASLHINGNKISLDYADQFRAPLEINRFKLKADISLFDDGLLLSVPEFEAVNSDIKAFGRLWLEVDKTTKPFLYLRGNFEDGNGSSAHKYLPIKLLPAEVINWLDRGIKSADVPNGDFLFHGRLESIKSLDQNKAGKMLVDFEVDNTEILFDSNWAPARNGKGHVQFLNMGMNIDLDRVSFESIDDASATVSIANFKSAVVEVDVITRTTTDIALKTWIGLPVGRKYEPVVKKLRNAEGSVLATIDLSLPIGKDITSSQRVHVNLDFDDAAVKIPAWGLHFSQIDGDLQIAQNTITGKGIRAVFYDDPVVIDVSTDPKSNQTLINANGLIESQRLLRLLPDYLAQGFSGRSQWEIGVGIANGKLDRGKPIVQIRAESELEDTEVLFPEPFSKPGNISRHTTTDISIFENELINFDLNYGSDIKARGRLKIDAEEAYRLSLLGVGFSTPLRPVSSSGIKIYGSIENFPLDDWIDYYRTQIASDNTNPGDTISLLDTLDLDIGTTLFQGRVITDTDLVMNRAIDGFTGTMESSLLKGDFTLPLQDSPQNPIIADLEYIKIQPIDSESQPTGMLPQDLFNLKLLSKVMSYGDFLVTDFRIDTRVEDNQLIVDSLAFRRDNVFLTSTASWRYLPEVEQHRSSLNLSIAGKELGQTLAALGFGDTMHNGTIEMDGKVKWSGELLHMDWESLVGDARLKITDGILKNVEPGSGRFVGLLSVSALPRRLALDFSDVLFDGLNFDKISGSYKVEGENLYTSDTKMKGTSADVKISGKIGLRERNYDQTLIVIPNIRHTLPILGTLAAGSAVGWGLLLLQNLFKNAIDKSVEIEYKVTGPWGNPQLDLVKKTVIEKEKRIYEK